MRGRKIVRRQQQQHWHVSLRQVRFRHSQNVGESWAAPSRGGRPRTRAGIPTAGAQRAPSEFVSKRGAAGASRARVGLSASARQEAYRVESLDTTSVRLEVRDPRVAERIEEGARVRGTRVPSHRLPLRGGGDDLRHTSPVGWQGRAED